MADRSADGVFDSAKVKQARAKLINEEHRLVLMKKIRQSQTRPVNPQAQQLNQSNLTGPSHMGGQAMKKLRQSLPSSSSTSASPHGSLALQKNHVSGTINNINHHLNSSSGVGIGGSSGSGGISSSSNSSPSLNQTPAHAHQRPKVNSLWNPPPQQARHPPPIGIAPPHVGNLSRQPITTPPNVVEALMSMGTSPQNLMAQIQAGVMAAANRGRTQQQQQQKQSHQANPLSSSLGKNQAAQLLLQKRGNLKSANSHQTLFNQQQQQQLAQKFGSQSALAAFSGATPPNLNKRSTPGIQSPHVGNLSRQPITTPPNVVQDMRGGLSGQQSLLVNANNSLTPNSRRSSQQSQPQQQSLFNKSQAAQMLLQKRTAAKSAIQKQLEQTLMQLPQKHIQLGIDFIPNANNIEFVYYVGLEACVDYLTQAKNPLDVQPLEKPLECSTCGTDFTPSWSWKRSQAVCENCVGNHVKKSIKNSQGNRIKSVLAKAAKQEQEMEQRIMAEAANVVSTPSPNSSTNQHSLLHSAPQPQLQRSSPQVWPRVSGSPLTTGSSNRSGNSSNSSATTTTTNSVAAAVAAAAAAAANVQPPSLNSNPLAALQPAALASLLQMNPQFSALASLMTANNAAANQQQAPTNTNNNTNQITQVAALLMNQLSMNLWKR